MSRILNVGIIQMPISLDTEANVSYLENRLAALMCGAKKPELVLGVEGLGQLPQEIPGALSARCSMLAKKYGIYLIPGSMYEKDSKLKNGMVYNSAPIFNPAGELLDIYQKMAPWRPAENKVAPGNRYVVFEIPEKRTKIGVQICYDLNFPEISRNETLLGAEILVKLTMDPQELYRINKPLHFARALENQAYLISTNAVGFYREYHMYGNSLVVSPEGNLLWEAGQEACTATITLDLDLVRRCRSDGTLFIDRYLTHLCDYNFPAPYAGHVADAPLYATVSKI